MVAVEENSEQAWLFDAGGNPVVLPAEATGFRVRCLPPGSRGPGELVFNGKSGIPLFVPRTTEPTEFAEMVGYRPGKYKLAAIDASYQYLPDVPIAMLLVTPGMAAAHQAATGGAPTGSGAPAAATSDPLLLELVREQLRAAKTASHADPLVLELVSVLRAALIEIRVALSERLGVIRAVTADGTRNVSELVRASATVVTAADGAGIARREPPPPPPPVPAALPAPAEDVGGGDPRHVVADPVVLEVAPPQRVHKLLVRLRQRDLVRLPRSLCAPPRLGLAAAQNEPRRPRKRTRRPPR